jgi:hypothetical protein
MTTPLAVGERVVVAHERHLCRGTVETVGATWVKVRLDEGGTVVRADLRPTPKSSDLPLLDGSVAPAEMLPAGATPDGGPVVGPTPAPAGSAVSTTGGAS